MEYRPLVAIAFFWICYNMIKKYNEARKWQRGVQQDPAEESVRPSALQHEGKGETSSSEDQKSGGRLSEAASASVASFLLDWMNLSYLEHEEAPHRVLTFDYQGGHFWLYVNNTTKSYRLMYPYFLIVDVEEESRLIELCQQLTYLYPKLKATTHYDGNANICHAQLFVDKQFSGTLERDRMQLLNGMDNCFNIQRKAEQMLKEARERPLPRFGSVLAHEEERMEFMAYRHAENAETPGRRLTDSMQSPFLLINLLGMLKATWLIDEPKSLTVVTSDSETLTDTTAIRNWQLLKPLLEQEGLKCVTYVVGYGEERVCLTLTRLEEDEKTACFLIECRAKGVDFEECIWHDKRSEAARLAEFSYMADEEGKGDVQTAGQEDNDGKGEQPWDCHLYWGKKAFLEERFLNAIDELEKAFEMMKSALADMTEEQKETFSDVIWMLGHSYLELGLYKTAFYYLSTFQEEGHLNQRRDFINTLVAARDHRAYDIVSEEMSLAERYIRQNCKDEDCSGVFEYLHLTVFRSFVKVCTDQRLLTEAETILNMLSTDESNQDFVEEYTERIRQLREAEKRNDKETE